MLPKNFNPMWLRGSGGQQLLQHLTATNMLPPSGSQFGVPQQPIYPQFAGQPPQGALAPMPFEGGAPGWGGKGAGMMPGVPQSRSPFNFSGSIRDMIQQVLGRVAGSSGSRGPDRNPFAGLARFAGPFGNGGGPLLPTIGQFPNMRRF